MNPIEPDSRDHLVDGAPAVDPYGVAPDRLEPDELQEQQDAAKPHKSFWRELPILVLIALVVAVVIKTFFLQAFFIPSGSMKETLQVDDRVLVNKLSYRFGDLERGDVIVFDDPRGDAADSGESVGSALLRNLAESIGLSTPQSEFIKRVVALPGETIEVSGGGVLVDGLAIDEPYLQPGLRQRDFGPETIPEGFVFVMGDNRNSSVDSTVFGPIPKGDIVGRAFVIVWPLSNWSGL